MKMLFVKISLADLKEACKDFNLTVSEVKSIYENLCSTSEDKMQEDKNKLRKIKPQKLKDVLNPKSKYYDKTWKLTKQLSLLWYNHQHGLKRLRHKRITKESRQWSMLVALKNEILKLDGITEKNFAQWTGYIFREAEHISESFGKSSPYLSLILNKFDEIIDTIDSSMEFTLTKRHKRVWKRYCIFRSKILGRKYFKELQQGSEDHRIIHKVTRTIRQYGITIDKFMKIQFDAFSFHGSFPRLKNLITDSCIDRLDQALFAEEIKNEQEKDKPKSKYWDDVEKSFNKN